MTDVINELKNYVEQKIYSLTRDSNASSKADLANLRRAVGKKPGSVPEIWGLTIGGLPERFTSKNLNPNREEWTVHIALTLFSLHQQSADKLMHSKGKEYSLGNSVRKLVKTNEDESRVKRRFDSVSTSSDIEELSNHLRGLIQILKTDSISLDYTSLTEDIYLFQNPEMKDKVKLKWGRDYYSYLNQEKKISNNNAN